MTQETIYNRINLGLIRGVAGMCTGILIAQTFDKIRFSSITVTIVSWLLFIIVIFSVSYWETFWQTEVLALASFSAILLLSRHNTSLSRVLSTKRFYFFVSISFSLYLSHTFVIFSFPPSLYIDKYGEIIGTGYLLTYSIIAATIVNKPIEAPSLKFNRSNPQRSFYLVVFNHP